MKKRVFSLALALAMVVGMLPSTVLATELEPGGEPVAVVSEETNAPAGETGDAEDAAPAEDAEPEDTPALLEADETEPAAENASGTSGDVNWSYDASTKTMTISGTGAMENYSPYGSRPWDSFRDEITKLVVESGVTNVGNATCYQWSALEEAVLPNTVTKIGGSAFYNCEKLAKVNIPDSVTYLGDGSFNNCKALTAVTIPGSVQEIYDGAFSGCSSLKDVTLGDKLPLIGSNMFKGCTSLTSITIPSSVTSIEYYAFRGCTALESAVVPDSVTNLGSAFFGCTSLTSVKLPSTLTALQYGVFNGCKSLEEIDIPDTVTSIGDSVFSGCAKLKSVTLPSKLTELGKSAFSGCAALTAVELPNTLTTLNSGVFRDCTGLTSMVIPASVTTLPNGLFEGCTALTSVTIPATVTSLGDNLFEGCTALATVELPAAITAIPEEMFLDCTGLTSVTIPASVTTLGASAFSGCTKLTSAAIPTGVTELPESLFNGCTSLETVTIPTGVATIGESVFNGCTSLKTVTLPEGITKIDSNAFDGCTSLAVTSLPASVAELGDSVFHGCTSLTDMTVSASTVGKQVFSGCTGLKTAAIKTAGEEMFSGCTALTKVTFLEGAATLGSKTFNGCTALTEIVVPASLTDWGSDAFGGLDYTKITFSGPGKDNFAIGGGTVYNADKTVLYSVDAGFEGEFTIPATVTTLGSNCFAGCTKLTGVVFAEGSKLTAVGSGAFSGCAALTALTLPETVTTIGDDAFNGCAGLAQMILPAAVTTIGDRAFKDCAKLTRLDLPKALVNLGSEFAAGTAVEEIIIPENVTEVKPFGQCDALKHVVVRPQLERLSGMLWTNCKNLESLVMPSSLSVTSFNLVSFKDSFRVVYFTGTKDQFQNLNFYKNRNSKPYFTSGQVAVVCNYVEPTTETGKLEVAQQPENIKTDTLLAAAGQVSMQLKYPEGTAPKEGDKIWADWYHTAETPNGLHHVFQFSSYELDADTLTTTVSLGEQAALGKASTWHYICVAYKTDADGNTTMMVSQPVTVEMEEKSVELKGTGTETDPYQIGTFEEMVAAATKINSGAAAADSHLELTADLTLPKGWMQLGTENNPFKGVFDGKDHTITYEKGAKSLINRMSGGKVRNVKLQGEYILGSALASAAPGAEISNCTLLSGSATQKSGILTVAGSGSGYSAVETDIIGCTVESGVKIGWDANKNCPTGENDIGSITGGGNFVIRDCKSAAEVYGVSNVGGIVGVKGSSMGAGAVSNSQFTGKITATGEYVGGIMGRGYDSYTAPNSPCARINNCYVNADISGAQAVGGIFGGEGGVDQCWSNGVGHVRDSVFIGSLSLVSGTFSAQRDASYPAANVGGSKGAVVGFMRSLNKYNDISNNYYYLTSGSEAAIGAVEHIDTSAVRPMGMHDDGTFYYDTSVDDLAAIKEFVDAEDKGTSDWDGYSSVLNKDSNRTDDPLGKDADKLGKLCTDAEMKNGTVVKLLNSSTTSMHNWVQGENGPELSDKAVPYALEISGSYKTEYYIGEELDMTGAEFTVTWSDGSVTHPTAEEMTFTGFDSSSRKVLTVVASYSSASAEFTVKVLKRNDGGSTAPSTISVYFTLLGDTKHDYDGTSKTVHTLKNKNLTTWVKQTKYTVDANATVTELLEAVEAATDNVSFTNPTGKWVSAVTFDGLTLEELDNTTNSGWMYTINGKHPLLRVDEQFLEDGDKIVFHWTDDYTVEEGSEDFDNSGNHLGGNSSATTTPDTSTSGETVTVAPGATADKNGEAKASVSSADMKDAVSEAKNAKADVIAIEPDVKGDASKVTVTVPVSSAVSVGKDAGADLALKSDIADVKIAAADLKGLTGSQLTVSAAENANGTITVTASVDGKALNSDVAVTVPGSAKAGQVLVVVNADGTETIVKKSVSGKDGVTGLVAANATVRVMDNSKTFSDTVGHWGADAISFVSSRELFNGVGGGLFAPERRMTRGMLVTVLSRLEDTSAKAADGKFSDVSADYWCADAITWAADNGIVGGYADGSFGPEKDITREQMAAMLYRYAKYLGMDTGVSGDLSKFSDKASVSAFAQDAMQWAVGNGIIAGTSNGTLNPGGYATRVQVAVMLQRMVALMVR